MADAPKTKTPGQVAYESFRAVFDTGKLAWHELNPFTRQGWEIVAQRVKAS